jgi:hypothetical protein
MILCSVRKSGENWKECRHHCKRLAKQYYFYRMMTLDDSPVYMSIDHPLGGNYEVVFMPRGSRLQQSQYCEVHRNTYGNKTYGDRFEVELLVPDYIVPELDPNIPISPMSDEDMSDSDSESDSEFTPGYSERRYSARRSPRRYSARRSPRRYSARRSPRRYSARRSPRRYSARRRYSGRYSPSRNIEY